MSCSSCFSDFLVKCNTTITLFIEITTVAPYDTHNWVITDKRGHKYTGILTQEGPAEWTIDVADLPAGFLTEYSGDFRLEVMNGAFKVKFKIAQETDCIEFDIHGGDMVKDNLGVEF